VFAKLGGPSDGTGVLHAILHGGPNESRKERETRRGGRPGRVS
jgi:hypothetical protein